MAQAEKNKICAALCFVIIAMLTAACARTDSLDPTENVQTMQEERHEIDGLEWQKSVPLTYATGFSIEHYKDGFRLITVSDGSQFLIVPNGLEVPQGLKYDIRVIKQPVTNLYLAATAVMDMFRSLDAIDTIKLSGTDADGWYIEEAKQAMERGELLYAGKYNIPDYELILSQGCQLAIENTMILHTPEVKEQLETLGIPVLIMARVVDKMSMLIVGGVMIGYICSAVTDIVVTFADDADIVNLHNWSKGSFSGITWDNVTVLSVTVFVTTAVIFLLSKPIGAYQMGEVYAQSVGVNLRLLRILLVFLSSVLAACITAFAGPVSFVGIAVPHLMKWLFGTAKPIVMIPACFLGCSVFCLFCDLLARTMFAPTEMSISTVTAVFGAPIVIIILLRKQRT